MSKARTNEWYNSKRTTSTCSSEPFGVMGGKEISPSQNTSKEGTCMNTSSETWQLGNQAIQVSHLEKVYWPQTGFTKGELLDYYRQIAPVLLPYLKDRPVTLRMYPQPTNCATRL